MKYTINIGVRGRGVRLFALNEEELSRAFESESLDEVFDEIKEEREYDFQFERTYYTSYCDRFGLEVKDENGEIVYETDDIEEFVSRDKTYNDDGDVRIEGWKFRGIEDGIYLTRISTEKGVEFEGEIELDEPFNPDKLYIIRDRNVDDELLEDDVFCAGELYYQKGDKINLEEDLIYMDDIGWNEEQYYDTFLYKLTEKNWWQEYTESE